jgi:hypothetical protein
MRLVTIFLICLVSFGAPHHSAAQDNLAVDLPAEVRQWFRNPDGSCVQ